MIILTPYEEASLHTIGEEGASDALRVLELGGTHYYIPYEHEGPDALLAALAAIPPQESPKTAIWRGTIPSFAYYNAVYQGLHERGIHLINAPDEHRLVFEFDLGYPLYEAHTAKSVVLTRVEEAKEAAETLGFPVFVKGALLSLKHYEWKACIANNLQELEETTARLLANEYLSRGRVIVRELLPLRKEQVGASEIPAGREFRVFVHKGEVVSVGYYWPYLLPFSFLSEAEESAVRALAEEVAGQFITPFVSLDIGQLEDGRWVVIETGDPQFSGTSLMDSQALWEVMYQRLS